MSYSHCVPLSSVPCSRMRRRGLPNLFLRSLLKAVHVAFLDTSLVLIAPLATFPFASEHNRALTHSWLASGESCISHSRTHVPLKFQTSNLYFKYYCYRSSIYFLVINTCEPSWRTAWRLKAWFQVDPVVKIWTSSSTGNDTDWCSSDGVKPWNARPWAVFVQSV